jgi:uncharacterized damage-inducible protein DinB
MNADQYFDHWNKIWRDLMRGVSLLEDKHLDYRPAEGYKRTVGDILQHIINLELGWIHYVVRREHEGWPDETSGITANVKAIQSEMERVHKDTTDYLSTLPVEEFTRIVQVPGDGAPKLSWILWHVLEQQIHHRGELFLCLSLLGLERPKTDRPE